ncbi:MAG TPA: lipopolysaccharide transport periplasmic protein LptA [Nitrospirae bacterium]|nr:lipopolysaccharide transport periplasmic protein LptA [Nitrospirota bacterium]
MLKVLFTVRILIILLSFVLFDSMAVFCYAVNETPIVITSQTLTVDSKNNTAVFEGGVVAKTGDIVIYSDKMEVSYSDVQGKITSIHASGKVRVHKEERAIFSEEAHYSGVEEKITFTGAPKVVDGENMISGSEIIYFIEDDRTVVRESRVIIKQTEE